SVIEFVVQSKTGVIAGSGEWLDPLAQSPELSSGQDYSLVSSLVVPLIARDEALGTLSIRSKQANAYSKRDLILAQRAATHLSSSIVNSQLYAEQLRTEQALRISEAEAHALARQQEVMAEIGKVISSSLDIDEVYEEFAQEVQKLIHFETLHISIMDHEKRTSIISYVSGANNIPGRQVGDAVGFAGSMAGKIVRSRVGAIIQNVSLEWIEAEVPALSVSFKSGMRSFLGVPLVHNNQTIAVLQIRTAAQNAYTNEDLAVARLVADQIAGTIANSELYAQLKASQEAQDRLTTMMNATTDLVGIANHEGRVIYMNQAGRDLLKITHDDQVLNVPITDFHPSWANTIVQNEAISTAIQNGAWEGESAFVNLQGIEFPVSMVLLSHKSADGEVEFLSTISRDISAAKRASDELQRAKDVAEAASSAKSEFLANMSHEIRTPLNAISGFTQLMTGDAEFPDKQRNYLNMVSQSAESLSQIVNDILDFSKIEAGKLDFEEAPFDLRTLVVQTVAMFSLKAKEKGLKLNSTIDDNIENTLTGDPGRLGQVLVNLIGNAIKFTDQGSVTLDVRTDVRSDSEISLRFSVTDTGVGIPQDRQDAIFDAFSQADSSTTRNYGGTGLGLTIATQLVRHMGGRIWLESQTGVGSKFQFTANFRLIDETLTTPPSESEQGSKALSEDHNSRPGASFNSMKVLLVEDNDLNQMLASEILELNGYEVVVAENGRRALQLIDEIAFDLVLMDIHMPVLDGYQATRAIRESEVITETHIPIIAMTANAMDGDEQKCHEAGMDGFIAKPFRPDRLVSVVKKALSLGEGAS
ncbi:MAG: ATP-binding protein, partial [SAR202 cluster bacterium]|nr:ATP-binding protein [SAR202 cluster bacterium]